VPSREAQEQTPVEVLGDLLHERAAAGLPPRPRPGDRSRPRAHRADPPVLVVRAIAGAALSVCAVALGIVGLAWTADAPQRVAAVAEQAAIALSPTPSPVPSPSAAAPRAAASPVLPAPAPTVAPPAREPVTVLNNSRITGLAAHGAERFRAGGWPVAAVGNFRGRIPVTTVYYDPGLEATAREFAGAFQGVVRVRPRFAGLPARGVVVVLTREFPR
jgi:hypothetical protein